MAEVCEVDGGGVVVVVVDRIGVCEVGGGGGRVAVDIEVVEVDEDTGSTHWLLPHVCPGLHALQKSPTLH